MHSYDDFMMHLLFYCVVLNCTVMVISQCIYTHCNSKSHRHSLNTNWNIIFIKPTKAINSIYTFSACFKCDSNDNQFSFVPL